MNRNTNSKSGAAWLKVRLFVFNLTFKLQRYDSEILFYVCFMLCDRIIRLIQQEYQVPFRIRAIICNYECYVTLFLQQSWSICWWLWWEGFDDMKSSELDNVYRRVVCVNIDTVWNLALLAINIYKEWPIMWDLFHILNPNLFKYGNSPFSCVRPFTKSLSQTFYLIQPNGFILFHHVTFSIHMTMKVQKP